LFSSARGIVAEILFCGFAAKKIGAESPFFLPAAKKRAQFPALEITWCFLLGTFYFTLAGDCAILFLIFDFTFAKP
jgi:hypothetical protein